MLSEFKELFYEQSNEENGILCFGNEADGDCFDQTDYDIMRKTSFSNSLKNQWLLENNASRYLIYEIVNKEKNIIDLACGPGMGLVPSIKQVNPSFICLATDANPILLKEWKRYIERNTEMVNTDFAQFSLFSIPIKNDSVTAYSSFAGISSTRNGSAGYEKVLSEIYRTLTPGGKLYTIETEWVDIFKIHDVFDKMNQKPWTVFFEKQKTWHDYFVDNNFEIEYEELVEYHRLTEDDNELGAAAKELGIGIDQKVTAFILSKPINT